MKPLFETIQDAIQDHRLRYTVDSQDEDSGLSVLDKLTPVGEDSVTKGIEECELLTESILEAIDLYRSGDFDVQSELKAKAEQWDALHAKMDKFYKDGSGDDLLNIGEVAAEAFGYKIL